MIVQGDFEISAMQILAKLFGVGKDLVIPGVAGPASMGDSIIVDQMPVHVDDGD